MDIPEDVREAAEAALRGANIKAHMTGEATDPIECISTAILAERERATAAERERCALVAREHAAGRLSQSANSRTLGKKAEARDFESMSMCATDIAAAILNPPEQPA